MLIRSAIVVLVLMIGAVLAGNLLFGEWLEEKFDWMRPAPSGVRVSVEPVRLDALTEVVKAPGKIEPKKMVHMSAEVSAKIMELPFEEGDTVRKGDIVVRLDDRDLKASVASAKARHEGEEFRLQSEQARLTGSLSSLGFAEKQLERKQSLYDTGDISRKELDDALERVEDLEAVIEAAKYNISVIESSLVSAKADIDRAQDMLSKTIISSPIDGVITALNTEEGEVAMVGTMNNAGTVIMTISDLNRMLLIAEISENDISKIAVDQESKIYITAFPDEVFGGAVSHIALTRSVGMDGSGFFLTEIEVQAQGRLLRSGLTANVDIEVAQHEGLVVPSQAVVDVEIEDLPQSIKRDNPLIDHRKTVTYVVYRVIEGAVVITPVQPGASDVSDQLILRGLSADDVVITGPYQVLAAELEQGTGVINILDELQNEQVDQEGDAAEALVDRDDANKDETIGNSTPVASSAKSDT